MWREVASEKAKISRLLSRVSVYLFLQGRSGEAEEIDVKVLELRREVLSEKHPDTIGSMASLVTTYWSQNRGDEAETLDTEVLEIRLHLLGPKHPNTLSSMTSLADTWKEQGREKDAITLMVQAIQV
jgi:hypothetical protein